MPPPVISGEFERPSNWKEYDKLIFEILEYAEDETSTSHKLREVTIQLSGTKDGCNSTMSFIVVMDNPQDFGDYGIVIIKIDRYFCLNAKDANLKIWMRILKLFLSICAVIVLELLRFL